MNLSHPSVLLWALKPHDEGIERGVVARVWNLASEPSLVRLTAAFSLAGAQRVTHIERPLEPLPLKNGLLETTVPGHRLESFALTPPR